MLAPALVLSLVFQAIPGTPEPQPGDTGEGGALVTWGNDAFGLPPGPDDHRTNQLTVWGRWRDFQLVLDDSMMTDRESGTRCDVLTATFGYQLAPGLYAGGGYRFRGDLGGDDLQGEAHRVIDVADDPSLAYGDDSSSPLAYFVYLTQEVEGGVGYQSITAGLVTLDGDIALDQAARGLVTWRWLTVWGGTRYQWRETAHGSDPALTGVDEYERGLWVEAGVRFGHVAIETRYNTRTDDAVGSLTLFIGY